MAKLPKVYHPEYEIECNNVFVFCYAVLRLLPVCVKIMLNRIELDCYIKDKTGERVVLCKHKARVIPHFIYKKAGRKSANI